MPSPQLHASVRETVISPDRRLLDRIATRSLAFEGSCPDDERDGKRRLGADAERPHRITYRCIDA